VSAQTALYDISLVYRRIFQHEALGHVIFIRALTSMSVNFSFATINIQ